MRVSLVVPTLHFPGLAECMATLTTSIADSGLDLELVVVCDEPDQARDAVLAKYQAAICYNPKRVGVPRAYNQALKTATGEIIVLLNDDMLFAPGWLPPLVQALTSHPEFGYVSPIIDRPGRDRLHYFGALGEASAMTRACYEMVGMFDESDHFRYLGTDGDYYVRTIHAGYRPHGVVESMVQHLVSQTVGAALTQPVLDTPTAELDRRYGTEHRVDQHLLPAYSTTRGFVEELKGYADVVLPGYYPSWEREQLAALQVVENCRVLSLEPDPRLPDHPAMTDYRLRAQLSQFGTVAHLAGPLPAVLDWADTEWVTMTCAPQDRQTLREEAHRQGRRVELAAHQQTARVEFERCAAVIVPSDRSAALVTQWRGRPVVIPPGIDRPDRVLPLPSRFTVGYLGTTTPTAGLVYLLRAWKAARLRSELMLAVDDPATAEALIAHVGASHHSVQVEAVPEDRRAFYRRISVICAPSVDEPWSVAVAEAMRDGRPALVSTGDGAHTLVQPGCGYTHPPRDWGALAEQLLALEKEPGLTGMGHTASWSARTTTWDHALAKYIKLFARIGGLL